MKKAIFAIVIASVVTSAMGQSDSVVDAYTATMASANAALSMQKRCEASAVKNDLKPCYEAEKLNDTFQERSKEFLSSVQPKELFLHVTPEQMSALNSISAQLNDSIDAVAARLDASKH